MIFLSKAKSARPDFLLSGNSLAAPVQAIRGDGAGVPFGRFATRLPDRFFTGREPSRGAGAGPSRRRAGAPFGRFAARLPDRFLPGGNSLAASVQALCGDGAGVPFGRFATRLLDR